MPFEPDALYTCPSCNEENAVGVDPTAGRRQRFVEDCPVCCKPLAVAYSAVDGELAELQVEATD